MAGAFVVGATALACAGLLSLGASSSAGHTTEAKDALFGTRALSAAAGVCELSDRITWHQRGRSSFSADVDRCARKCWGASACVTSCIREARNYSEPCARCFADSVTCSMAHCSVCVFGGGAAPCLECNYKNCRPSFQRCTGMPCTNSTHTTRDSACVSAEPENESKDDLLDYWDGQCTACPAKLYESEHCREGGRLAGQRPCGATNSSCEGQCEYPAAFPAPNASLAVEVNQSLLGDDEYWDEQCTPCPAKLYPKAHCLEGGELLGEGACGPWRASCVGRCRRPLSSQPPTGELYWSGRCTACPAYLYSDCPRGGTMVSERYCGRGPPFDVQCEGRCRKPAGAPEPADWIVVGGGAAGCAAAAALADAGEDVLLLERGPSDLEVLETMKAKTWPGVVNTQAAQMIQWTDGTWGAAARVLGGGTSINGGLCIEEEPEWLRDAFGPDFDLAAFYESSRLLAENLSSPLQPSGYGKDLVEAFRSVGLDTGSEAAAKLRWQEGVWIPYSTINTSSPQWTRRGAAVLLHERGHFKNLRFLTQFLVKRIVFEGARAVGVRVANQFDDETVVKARKGVILAAGAIFTPQLLQISGIGDPSLLARLGVNMVHPLPAVGSNFVDRTLLDFGVWSSNKLPLFVGYAMAANKSLRLTFESEGWGKVASAFVVASLGLVPVGQRTRALRGTLDLLMSPGLEDIVNNMMQFVALHHETHSRGNIEAVSSDASEPPRVTANHLKDPRDMERQLIAAKELMRLLESEALQKYFKPKDLPTFGKNVSDYLSCIAKAPNSATKALVVPCPPSLSATREDWFNHFRKTAISSYHYFGTASHGAVLTGGDLRVRGTTNLHVADASAIPMPTRVNPQCTVMALGHYVGKRVAAPKDKAPLPTQPAPLDGSLTSKKEEQKGGNKTAGATPEPVPGSNPGPRSEGGAAGPGVTELTARALRTKG